ncbi:hypothetical protein [Hahella ganghwensis]|uniref:hypothetical protein n=1 Tax=Hahella ganghwensis TaxID=286420 RepID=UPI000381139A|nr:hypothetical protein [Hahella ganghwensis]
MIRLLAFVLIALTMTSCCDVDYEFEPEELAAKCSRETLEKVASPNGRNYISTIRFNCEGDYPYKSGILLHSERKDSCYVVSSPIYRMSEDITNAGIQYEWENNWTVIVRGLGGSGTQSVIEDVTVLYKDSE